MAPLAATDVTAHSDYRATAPQANLQAVLLGVFGTIAGFALIACTIRLMGWIASKLPQHQNEVLPAYSGSTPTPSAHCDLCPPSNQDNTHRQGETNDNAIIPSSNTGSTTAPHRVEMLQNIAPSDSDQESKEVPPPYSPPSKYRS